jgi:hypothetical protein
MDCEDWWMVTDPSNYSLNKLSNFFKDEKVIKAIIQAQKLETIAVSFLQFLSFDGSLDKLLWVPFKNLMFFVHQNCLVQFKFLLERLPLSTKANSWAVKLDKICETKLTRLFKTRAEALQFMKINNDSCKSVLKNI